MNMKTWHEPPIAKVYEALGALADGRVKTTSSTSAEVLSSSKDKTYTVEWSIDYSSITSNDNASFWQGYCGYPIIAVLLLAGRLSYDKTVSDALKSLPWKQINDRFKGNYDKAISQVLDRVQALGGNRDIIVKECERIHAELKLLKIGRPQRGRKPPSISSEQMSTQGDKTPSQPDLL